MSPEPPSSPEPELKTERVQLLMAPSEVAAIDDWGFSHRIRTRAEAMRRLCQIGLASDEASPKQIMRTSVEVANRLRVEVCEELLSLIKKDELTARNASKVLDVALDISVTALSLVHMTAGESFAAMVGFDDMELSDVAHVAGQIRADPRAYAELYNFMNKHPDLTDEQLIEAFAKWREEKKVSRE